MNGGAAALFQRLGELRGFVGRPAALDPIGPRDANGNGPVGGKRRTYRVEDLEREPHPIC